MHTCPDVYRVRLTLLSSSSISVTRLPRLLSASCSSLSGALWGDSMCCKHTSWPSTHDWRIQTHSHRPHITSLNHQSCSEWFQLYVHNYCKQLKYRCWFTADESVWRQLLQMNLLSYRSFSFKYSTITAIVSVFKTLYFTILSSADFNSFSASVSRPRWKTSTFP